MADSVVVAKIVLVEDDEEARALLLKLLAHERYEVACAATAIEALDVIKPDVDLVLLDRKLPGALQGDDVIARMKDKPSLADIPVIILSGMTRSSSRCCSRKSGRRSA